MALLEVRGLRTTFRTSRGQLPAVDGVDLDLEAGTIVGLVGESGSGKSVTARSILGLLPRNRASVEGSVRLDGTELIGSSEAELRRIRGRRIAMVFQDPMTSLNPVLSIEDQIVETVRAHHDLSRRDARQIALDRLREVGVPSPERRLRQYPHELSGGLRQRVMIAIALSCDPEILLADEPTTALDVTIQSQILRLLQVVSHERRMAILLITHDLGVVAETCSRVVVMYAGRIVETSPADEFFVQQAHPYSAALLRCLPQAGGEQGRLFRIEGAPPDPLRMPPGCRFGPRCPLTQERCRLEDQRLLPSSLGTERQTACWRSDELLEQERRHAFV